jgi:peptide/nickel transport system permease protein
LTDGAEIPFAALPAPGPPRTGRASLRLRDGWRALSGNPQATAGLCILVAMLVIAVFAPLLGASDPRAMSIGDRLQAASAHHWLGTDALGRDVYSRVIYGARVSLAVGFFAALFSCVVGAALGLAAGANRPLDGLIMRVMDGLMSIPPILLAIALMAVTGASAQNVILAVTMVEAPRVARLVRGIVLSLREQLFVEAAVASGSSGLRIVVRHLLPGVLGPLTVQAAFVWGAAMLIEAALSFIGAGIPPTTPSWGNVMADGKVLWQIRPDLVFVPAAFLSVTVLGVNLLGDGLRKVLDPHVAGTRS